MAHVVSGIDLGASAVKFVLIEVGFRVTRLLSAFEEPVPPGEAPLLERQGEALTAGLARLPAESMSFVALPGEMLAVRVLDLPFADPRKIDQVVGYELEGQIVHALSDVVFDHVVLKAGGGAAGVAPGGDGTAVMAAAARVDELGDFLAALAGRGLQPHALYAGPIVYHTLFAEERTALPVEARCRMLVDLGQNRTNVCFLMRGEAVYARAITRGGDALTAAVGEAFKVEGERAEQGKRDHGFVGSAARPPGNPVAQKMDSVLRVALTPLLRELRQTMASFRARDKTPVEAVLITGGGAELAGLAEYLQEELELPVSRFAPEIGTRVDLVEDDREAADDGRFTLAAAVAWAGARGGKEIDLRRGPFQYQASFSVLRQKARHLALLAAALLACASVDGIIALRRLTKQQDQLQAQLRVATQELFGEPRTDAKAVATLLKKGFREEMAPIPKATAFDLLGEISRRLPGEDKIKLDIKELDIRPKKTVIRGTVDSAAAVDEMAASLKEIDCFEEIIKGRISGEGAKEFDLTINSKCP
jgi:type IV pilus assembly protein PilM